jgi:hypothetical protein
MADFYPKKKRKKGPSKNDEKLQRAQSAADDARAAGTLVANFPGVAGLKVSISIKGAQGQLLEEKTLNIGANDPFLVATDCPGACGSGKFEFADYVAEALTQGRLAGKVDLPCGMPSYGGGSGGTCACVASAAFEARK